MKKAICILISLSVLCAGLGVLAAGVTAGGEVDAYAWSDAPIQVPMPQLKPAPKQISGYTDKLLGRAQTRYETYASQANRNHNMLLATKAVDYLVLQPGEVFSYNKAVGERSQARGFKVATVFEGNEKVPGLGGGICQISSTLYMATKAAGLQVVERHAHSIPVTYCGRDDEATVAWGYLDYRFKNNLNVPIRIEASMGGGVVKIALWSMTPVYE